MEDANTQPGLAMNHQIWFGTSGGWLYGLQLIPLRLIAVSGCVRTPILPDSRKDNVAAGIFALAFHDSTDGVAVGGDYTKPQDGTATAAYTRDGIHWQVALHPPAGYRSTVAWDGTDSTWIASGPGGTDTSHDGGKTWKPLDGENKGEENWNAMSLPFAVGPHGHIGRLISWGQLRAENRSRAHGTSLALPASFSR
jgi:hypothetical protein